MSNQELKKYIKKQLDKGIKEEKIKKILLEKGWDRNKIEEALSLVKKKSKNFSRKRKREEKERGTKKIIAGIILLLLLGGIGLIFDINNPTFGFFTKSPEEILNDGVVKTINYDSFTYKLNASTKASAGEILSITFPEIKYSINIEGVAKREESSSPLKTYEKIELGGATEGAKMVLKGEIINNNKASFTKIKTFPTSFGEDSFSPKNEWIQNNSYSNPIQKISNEKFNNLFSLKKVLGPKKDYHYLVTLNKKEAKNLISSYLEENERFSKPETKKMTEEKLYKLVDNFNSEFEVWLDRKDHYLKKIKFINESEDSSQEFSLEFSNFNKKVTIETPDNYSRKSDSLDSLYRSMTDFIYNQTDTIMKKTKDARRESDIRQISIAMEMNYDENQAYITTPTMPNSIGSYMTVTPKDPNDHTTCGENASGGNGEYCWIDNTKNNQKYCVYAELEGNAYFIASPDGTKLSKNYPRSLDCNIKKYEGELSYSLGAEVNYNRSVDLLVDAILMFRQLENQANQFNQIRVW